MSGTLILGTILAYFGLLLLIAEFTARRVDNDAFFVATASHRGMLFLSE